jgi:hypothetical protein
MVAVNDITGDSLVSRTSEAYRNNYDAIFGKKGKTNEQWTGCNVGELAGTGQACREAYQGQSRISGETEDTPAHDRLPPDCQH